MIELKAEYTWNVYSKREPRYPKQKGRAPFIYDPAHDSLPRTKLRPALLPEPKQSGQSGPQKPNGAGEGDGTDFNVINDSGTFVTAFIQER